MEDLNKEWQIWYQGKQTSQEQQPQDLLLSDRPSKPNDKSSSQPSTQVQKLLQDSNRCQKRLLFLIKQKQKKNQTFYFRMDKNDNKADMLHKHT